MSKTIPGQLTIFDLSNEPPRPCDYKFKRYIGQPVEVYIHGKPIRAKITGIEKYYTELDVGYVGTPYNLHPVEDKCGACKYFREVWGYDDVCACFEEHTVVSKNNNDPEQTACEWFERSNDEIKTTT